MKKSVLIVIILVVLLAIIIYLFSSDKFNTKKSNLMLAKLVNIEPASDGITGSNYISSAGYFEGRLYLNNQDTGEEYNLFVCTKDWSWVKEGMCYNLNLDDINTNIESHKFSSELSGCYVGILDSSSC